MHSHSERIIPAICSSSFSVVKRISGRWAAMTIASVFAAPLFWRFTNGRTYCGTISRT